MAAQQQMNLPTRSQTDGDDVIPQEDTSETANLFAERLRAWKHACAYLEDYVTALEKHESSQVKDYEKVTKTVSQPLREGEHFDQNLGGISEMFDNIRISTQNIGTSHGETAKQLKTSVLPIFEKLHTEIKNKAKEMTKTGSKTGKAVDKARAATQKHVEALATATASHGIPAGKADPSSDPYVLQRGVYHRLHKQVGEENAARGDMLQVQNTFSQFEAYVVQTMQQGMGALATALGTQLDAQRSLISNTVEKAQSVNPVFEWNGFVQRNSNVLVDPNQPQRTVDNIAFANKEHSTTQPMIKGSLERKSGLIKKWDTAFYVLTPGKFLHQYKNEDNTGSDPSPDLSLYLPDCTVGGCNGRRFDVKGKDLAKSGLGKAISGSKEYEFQAHSDRDAEQWWSIIRSVAQGSSASQQLSSPTSPAGSAAPSRSASAAHPPALDTAQPAAAQATSPQSAASGGYGGLGAPAHHGAEHGVTSSSPSAASPSGVAGNPGQY